MSWERGIGRLTAALLCVLALAAFLQIGVTQYLSGGGRAPVLDEWYYTDPANYLPNLLQRHNGHPFLFGRLILAADYYWAAASGDVARSLASLFGLFEALCVMGLAALLGARRADTLICVLALALIAVFSPQGAENFGGAFQATFLLAFAAAPAGLAALALYAARPTPTRFAATVAAALIATQTLAIGILLPPLMTLMAWRCRLPIRMIVALAAVSALGVALYVLTPINQIFSDEVAFGPREKQWFGIVLYALKALGGSLGTPLVDGLGRLGLALDASIVSFAVGFILAALIVVLGGATVLRRDAKPGEIAASLLGAFALMSVGALAYSRNFEPLGGPFWDASKYSPFGALAACAAGLLIFARLRTAGSRMQAGALAVAVLIAALAPVFGFRVMQTYEAAASQQAVESVGLAMGVNARYSPFFDAAQTEALFQRSNAMRAQPKWHFADMWSRRIGEVVTLPNAPLASCGAARTTSAPWGWPRTHVVILGDADRNAALRARSVLVLDADRRLIGYGRAPRLVGDVLLWAHAPSPWLAAAPRREVRQAGVSVYLADVDGVVCAITSLRRGG